MPMVLPTVTMLAKIVQILNRFRRFPIETFVQFNETITMGKTWATELRITFVDALATLARKLKPGNDVKFNQVAVPSLP